jgi:hypothetical protein
MKVTRLIDEGPRIKIIMRKKIMGYKLTVTSNSFQVVVSPLDVVVGTFMLIEHAPILWWPNGAFYVCGVDIVAKSQHETICCRFDLLKSFGDFILWQQVETQ